MSAGARAVEQMLTGAPRPVILVHHSFDAFRMLPGGQAHPVEFAAETLSDAVTLTLMRCQHRDFFVIRETETLSGKQTLHWFTVKRKSTARYVVVDHVTRPVHDLYAEHLFDLAVTSFDPVTPWAWAPGADVVGAAS